MIKKYVNVGQAIRWPATEGRDTVRGFGTSFDMEEAEAEDCIRNNITMIPQADFDSIGFTAAELASHKSPATWDNADAAFHPKLTAAWIALHNIREALKNPVPDVPAADPSISQMSATKET